MTVQVSPIMRRAEGLGGVYLSFWCPGCEEMHPIKVRDGQSGSPSWNWNGDYEKPTFSPSILITNGCKMPNHTTGTPCWCTFNAEKIAKGEEPSIFTCGVCHSYVREGRIEFLNDCTHAFAGQTVDLPELPEHLRDPVE